jgi:hypothetical protein
MARPRLKKGDITLGEVLRLSRNVYGKEVDDKIRRSKLDVLNAKITTRNGLKFNRSSKKWEQASREVKLVLLIKTDPVSYEKHDTVPVHKYPVTVLIKDFEAGMDSAFRWRTGSNARPKFPEKSKLGPKPPKRKGNEKAREEWERKKKREQTKRQNIINSNIQKGIQMQFFFELEWVLNQYGLLFGPDRTNGPPKTTNKGYQVFFDKHLYYCLTKIIYPLMTSKKGKVLNLVKRNETRV